MLASYKSRRAALRRPARRKGPDIASQTQVRTAVIGLGAIGPTHARWCSSVPESKLVGVCDTDHLRAKRVAADYRVAAYTDYREVIESADVDAVIIATPSFLHAQMAIDAVDCGKHVAIEKPLCLTLDEADRLIAAVGRAGVTAQYFENLCFSPAYRQAKDIIAAGAIGDVFFVRCREGSGGGIRAQQAVYDALHSGASGGGEGESLGSWYLDPAKSGGGQLISTGCHCITYVRWLLNRDPVARVYAEFLNVLNVDSRVEDAAYLTLRHRSGALASIETSLIDALGTFDDRAEIYGTAGTIFLDLYRAGTIRVYSQAGFDNIGASMFGRIDDASRNWSYPMPDEYWTLGYEAELRAFLRSILDGEPVDVTLDDGRETLRVIMAGYESARAATPVALS